MPKGTILTSLHGRKIGLDHNGGLVLDGNGISLNNQNIAINKVATVTITSPQLLALNATPKTLVAAPGSGLINVFRGLTLHKPAGTAYGGIASGEDLVVKYTNGSGVEVSAQIETTGFLDQTTLQQRFVGLPASAVTLTPNAALVLHLLVGEITTGDTPLYAKIIYDTIDSGFTS
jgi:hypothetical protein